MTNIDTSDEAVERLAAEIGRFVHKNSLQYQLCATLRALLSERREPMPEVVKAAVALLADTAHQYRRAGKDPSFYEGIASLLTRLSVSLSRAERERDGAISELKLYEEAYAEAEESPAGAMQAEVLSEHPRMSVIKDYAAAALGALFGHKIREAGWKKRAQDAAVSLSRAREEALEEAAKWHDDECARLDEVEAHPPGLTQYGKDQYTWHHRASMSLRSLKSHPITSETKDE